MPSASNTSLQTHLHFWLEYWPLHPTLLYRHTCTSDLSIALYIFKTPLYTTCISDLIFPPCIQPIFILFTFLPYILPSTFNPLYTAYISFKYCTSHPTPIHTIYIFDLSIALYIQPPLYITFIISDLSIGLYIQPLFTLLSFLTWVLPSALITLYTLINFWRALPTTSNPSLHRLQFWLEYCPLHPTPLNNTYISDSSTALCIWHSRDENGTDKFFKFGEIWVFLYYCPEGFPWNPSCWSSSVLLKRNEECDYR